MQKQRKLTERVGGMFGGPRGRIGQYVDEGLGLVSGATTYGGQGLGYYWDGYPAVVSGLDLPDGVSRTGSNTDAVNGALSAAQLAQNSGMDGTISGAPAVAGNFSS